MLAIIHLMTVPLFALIVHEAANITMNRTKEYKGAGQGLSTAKHGSRKTRGELPCP